MVSEIEFNLTLINEHIRMWDPYTHIWKVDKTAFLENYREERHTAADFDALIINYSELANTVQIQETVNQVTPSLMIVYFYVLKLKKKVIYLLSFDL